MPALIIIDYVGLKKNRGKKKGKTLLEVCNEETVKRLEKTSFAFPPSGWNTKKRFLNVFVVKF